MPLLFLFTFYIETYKLKWRVTLTLNDLEEIKTQLATMTQNELIAPFAADFNKIMELQNQEGKAIASFSG